MSNELWIILYTLIGSGTGAGVVLFIQHMIKNHQEKIENYRELLSIQLSLNQILAIVLQIYNDYKESEEKWLKYYEDNLRESPPNEEWLKYRCIDLRRFNKTHTGIYIDWDFSQFLSKKENEDREILEYLIPARASYQHVNSVLDIRNHLYDKAQKILENIENKYPNNYEYQNNNIENILGNKIYVELQSTTDEYVKSIESAIPSIFETFKKTSDYITKKYPNHEPLNLKLNKKDKNLLNSLVESKNSKVLSAK